MRHKYIIDTTGAELSVEQVDDYQVVLQVGSNRVFLNHNQWSDLMSLSYKFTLRYPTEETEDVRDYIRSTYPSDSAFMHAQATGAESEMDNQAGQTNDQES